MEYGPVERPAVELIHMRKQNRWMFAAACAAVIAMGVPVRAQLYTLTKDQMIELTSQNKFERFPDGRPKIPDSLLQRARGMSAEEVWAGLNQFGNAGTPAGSAGSSGGRGGPAYRNQYEDGFHVL